MNFHIFFDPDTMPTVQRSGLNCLMDLLGGVGNSSTFVPSGPIDGARVTIIGEQGSGKGFDSSHAYVEIPKRPVPTPPTKTPTPPATYPGKSEVPRRKTTSRHRARL